MSRCEFRRLTRIGTSSYNAIYHISPFFFSFSLSLSFRQFITHHGFRDSLALPPAVLLLVLTRDFGALSPRPTPPAPTIAPIERASPFSLTYSSLLSAARWCAISQTRRTKETVTPQLAKLLIYSLFNQINERVDAHFYAPVQLFMVYGNCPKHGPTHTHIGHGRGLGTGPRAKLTSRTTALFPFAELQLARLPCVLYHFPLVLLFFPSASDRPTVRPSVCPFVRSLVP